MLIKYLKKGEVNMLSNMNNIYQEALSLPPIERIELIEHLYFSLDSSDSRKRIDALWAQEVEERISAYEQGELKSISAKDVFEKIDRGKIK